MRLRVFTNLYNMAWFTDQRTAVLRLRIKYSDEFLLVQGLRLKDCRWEGIEPMSRNIAIAMDKEVVFSFVVFSIQYIKYIQPEYYAHIIATEPLMHGAYRGE